MVFGTLYDVVAIQIKRSSNTEPEIKQEPATFRKTGFQNGGFLSEPDIAKVALPDDVKIDNGGGTKVYDAALSVEDLKVNVNPATRPTEERSIGIRIAIFSCIHSVTSGT